MSRRKQAKPRALKREAVHSEDESTEDTLPLGENNFAQEIQDSPIPPLEASSVDSDDEDALSTDMEDGPKYRCGGCRASFDDLGDFLEHHEDCITQHPAYAKWARFHVQQIEDLEEIIPSDEYGGSNGGGTATPPGSLRSLSGTPDETTLSPSPGSSSCCATPSSSSGGGGGGGTVCDPDSELSFTLGITESTPYGCQFCDRAFPRLSYLKRHEQVHSDQMPFRCDYCQRLFKHKRSRDRHVKLHTGDRKYRCTQCESAFSRSDHLKIHMKTHDNGKPYQCTVCNRGYNTAAALSSHMQNHKKTPQQELLVHPSFDQQQQTPSELSTTPLPPTSTKCGQCSAEFNNVADLQTHLTQRHCRNVSESPEPPKPLLCSFCPQVCTSPESLKDHLTQNHQGSCPSPVPSTNNAKYPEEGISPGVINSYKTERSSPSDHCQNLQDGQQPSRTERFSPGQQQQQLTCGFCSRCDFPSFESLQLHVQVLHTSQCNSISSNSVRNLVKQRPAKHSSPTGSAGFNCEFCCQSFPSLTSLQKHTLATHSFGEILAQQKKSADIYCSQCNIGFTSSNALLDHVHMVHEPDVVSHPLTLSHNNNNKRNLMGSRLRPNGVKHMKSSPILSNPPMSLFNGVSSAFYRRQNLVRSESPISSTVGGGLSMTPLKALSNTLLCNQCNAAFQDFESFRTHLKNHLDEAAGLGSHASHRFTCPECDVEFDNDHLLDGHVIGHFLSSTIEYGCQSCLKLFQKPDDLQKHLLDIHAHHLYRCALCKQVFDSKVSIQVHFAVKHSNECRTFKCISCGAYFRSELEFQVHVKVSHLSCPENSKSCQPFRCLLCDQVCPSEEQLRYHVATHKKPFPCNLCGEAFHVEFLLDRHVQTVHQNTGRIPSSSPVHHPFLSGQSKNPNLSTTEPTTNSTTSEDVAQNLSVKRSIPSFPVKGGDKNNPSIGTPDVLQRTSTPSPTSTSGTTTAVTTTPVTTSNLEFRCDVCDMCSFSTEAALNSHRRQVHNLRNNQKSGASNQPPALSLFCAYCNESCKSRHDLENHMKGHMATPTRHKCNICDEVCPSAATLAEHKLTHCKVVSSSTCIVCRIPLTTEEDFMSHLQQHNNGAKSEHGLPGPCVVCRQTLIAEVEMRMHAKFHARNCTNPEVAAHGSCCVCSRKFDVGNLIIRSLAKPSSSDVLPHTYMCKECFHSKSDDVPAQVVRCGDCGVKFENECEMQLHRRKCCSQFSQIGGVDDVNGKTYQCIKCQTSFESEAEIQAHVTCHVMQEGTDHECRLCQKVLDSPSKLQCHLIEHTFEGCPSFTCYMCSSVFTGSHLLQQHMLEHGLDARPYDCSRCHHKFYFRAELDNHSYIHQMEDHAKNLAKDCFKELRQFCSPALSLQDVQEVFSERDAFFPCRKCGVKFTTFTDLQRHTCLVRLRELNPIKKECDAINDNCKQATEAKFEHPIGQKTESHISEKKHGCPMCQKRFTRRENLRLHLKTRHQSEDTPYSCTQCGKAFSRKSLLKEHSRVHNESSARFCENCNQCFDSTQLLRHHQSTSHGRHFDHKCPVCGDLFGKAKGLEAHLDKAHQVQVQNQEQHLEKMQSPEPSGLEMPNPQTSDDSHQDKGNSAENLHPDEPEIATTDIPNDSSSEGTEPTQFET